MMREQAETRLEALRREYETGQRMLAELEARRLELQQTLLRVSGAIQVLEELLAAGEPTAAPGQARADAPA
jgi:flagellar biosynthesis chaperone FliJ